MKVLFLDVDGVLNSEETFVRVHRTWVESGNKTKEGDYTWPLGHLAIELIERLNTIVEATGCMVVLSSSWRKICELGDFRNFMTRQGFRFSDSIIDRTPSLSLSGAESCRGVEIQTWLDNVKVIVKQYVILDDSSFDIVKIHPRNLVQTNFKYGLQDEQVTKAIEILNKFN